MELLFAIFLSWCQAPKSVEKWKWECRADSKAPAAGLVRLTPKEVKAQIVSCNVPRLPGAFDGQGTFILELLIDEMGNVCCQRILSGSNHPIMKNAVLDAAKEWKFKPVMVQARAVPYTAVLALTVSWDTEKSGKECPKEKRRTQQAHGADSP